jgi:hypothetical protein
MRLGLAIAAACVAGVAAAADLECAADARTEVRECKRTCTTQFREAKDLCRNIDPVCGTACRDQRKACAQPFLDIRAACYSGCKQELVRDKAACPAEEPARDACVDAAQVAAFVCRDVCRENQQVEDGLRACRQQFRDCLAACPPPPAG